MEEKKLDGTPKAAYPEAGIPNPFEDGEEMLAAVVEGDLSAEELREAMKKEYPTETEKPKSMGDVENRQHIAYVMNKLDKAVNGESRPMEKVSESVKKATFEMICEAPDRIVCMKGAMQDFSHIIGLVRDEKIHEIIEEDDECWEAYKEVTYAVNRLIRIANKKMNS